MCVGTLNYSSSQEKTMSITYDGVANRNVTVGLAHHQLSTEINKMGDGIIPPYCDIAVRVDTDYRDYKAGMAWTIRLAKAAALANLKDSQSANFVLYELADGECVHTAFPRFDKDLLGSVLTIVILIQDGEGGQREQLIALEPTA